MTTPVTIGNATLYLGDCREILPTLGKVDACITDPPYEAEAHGSNRILGSGRDRSMVARELDFAAITEDTRAYVSEWAGFNCDGWMLAFCQAEAVAKWREAMERGGQSWRRAMIWVKPDSSPQLSGDRPAQGYESIAAAWCGKGASKWNGGGKRGVFVYGKHDPGMGHGGAVKSHPTQKPVALMKELVALFTNPHDVVADPFMGSGTTGVACATTGRHFIGIEQNQAYFDIACERIETAQRQGRMFA